MSNRHATYIVKDIQRGAEPKKDKEITLCVTTNPVDALKAVRKAVIFGLIEMTFDGGYGQDRQLVFTPQSYTRYTRSLPNHRTDSHGDDRFHGFMQYCTEEGFGDPCPPKVHKKKTTKKKLVKSHG